mgnify:CR=1 FL=1
MLGKKPGELLQGADTAPAIVNEMREALALQQSFNVDVLNYSRAETILGENSV